MSVLRHDEQRLILVTDGDSAGLRLYGSWRNLYCWALTLTPLVFGGPYRLTTYPICSRLLNDLKLELKLNCFEM